MCKICHYWQLSRTSCFWEILNNYLNNFCPVYETKIYSNLKHSYYSNITEKHLMDHTTRFVKVTIETCNMLYTDTSICKIDPQYAFYFSCYTRFIYIMRLNHSRNFIIKTTKLYQQKTFWWSEIKEESYIIWQRPLRELGFTAYKRKLKREYIWKKLWRVLEAPFSFYSQLKIVIITNIRVY